MIFLVVGTWLKGFDRLIQAVDKLIEKEIICDEVVAQIGNSSYKPRNMTIVNFCSPEEFEVYISKADVIISHAGIGTISQAVKLSKPIVILPRKSKLGECFDDHQFATTRYMEAEGKVLAAYEIDDLPKKLKQAKNFVPAQQQDAQGIIDAVQEFIDDVASEKC